jgi:hypothetical protein
VPPFLLELAAKITDSAPSMAFVISAIDEVTEHCFVVTLPLASSFISEREGKFPSRVAAMTSHPFSAAYFTHRLPVFPFAPITTIDPSPAAATLTTPRRREEEEEDDDDNPLTFFVFWFWPRRRRQHRAPTEREDAVVAVAAETDAIMCFVFLS